MSELEKKLREALTDMRYESSVPGRGQRGIMAHHVEAILGAVLPVVQEELSEGDYWFKHLDDYIANGSCPFCRASDCDGGHKPGCELGDAEDRAEKAESRVKVLEAQVAAEEDEVELKSIVLADLDSRMGQMAEKLEKLELVATRALRIMDFHAHRCPIRPYTNFSGMEEHLVEYRAVMADIAALDGDGK